MTETVYMIDRLPARIQIGRQTESGVERIVFDCSAWTAAFGDMELSVWHVRPGEAAAYPAAVTRDGGCVIWQINDADTAIEGEGTVEVLGMAGDRRKLSGVCRTRIFHSGLGSTQEMPEAAEPWVTRVLEAAERVDAAAQAAGHQPVIGDNGNWWLWDADSGGYADSGMSSQGGDEADGGYYVPSVDAEGMLSWTASKDDMPGVAPANVRGSQGDIGPQGPKGDKGDDGVGIAGVEQTTVSAEDGGSNVITVTTTDGATATFTVKNGSRGTKGDTGPQGPAGADGAKGDTGSPGKDGTSVTVISVSESTEDAGSNVVTFSDGATLTVRNGGKGSDGADGADGDTPVKGTDYWTADDRAEMIADMEAALASETWTFTLSDGTTVARKVVVV